MKLPLGFLNYLRSDAPKAGELSDFPLFFELWPEDELAQSNQKLQVETYAPGFIGFASDGGGEFYAFGPNGAVFVLPLIGMEAKVAVQVASSWTDFERKIIKA